MSLIKVPMVDFVLRPTIQKKILRGLLFAAPIFLFQPLMLLLHGTSSGVIPLPLFQLWITGAPYLYCMSLIAGYFEQIKLENGILQFGFLGRDRVSIFDIDEVTGDEGGDDFKESILIRFRGEDNGLALLLEDYDEHELRAFLSLLRENNPAASYTYSDVIPFESRGLIRFLHSINDSSTLTVELSKSPMEDALSELVTSHEKTFWIVYLVFWILTLCSLSFFLFSMGADWAQSVQVATPSVQDSQRTRDLASQLLIAESSPEGNFFNLQYLRVSFFFQLATDYLSNTGFATVLIALWSFAGMVIPLGLVISRIVSPTYLFIDPNSIGMGSTFLRWDQIRTVTLKKLGTMGDPMEGELVIQGNIGRISIHLSMVPELQRQRILRLVDRYAEFAAFDGEFMRTSNALFDIQFTDLWLEEKDSAPPKDTNPELQSIANGTYSVDSLLGYGGQGVTYLASRATDDHNDKEQVVIKELVLPNFADVRIIQDAMSRFERGARLLRDLDSPQVVKLLDHFLENGKAYLVMEYVKGQTIREFIEKNGALDLAEVKKLGTRLCEILAYLHERETPVIHCDFAPDNLIITEDGNIKLIDFDVARVVNSKAHTFIAGRPSYTPPEQFRGHPTRQSDIFALGAILHFIAQGTDPPPLCAGTASDDKIWPCLELEELIMSCCQFDESNRPESAAIVKERLASIAVEQDQRVSITSRAMEPG
ncbi:MAG: serine/threonine protein kinase [Candidatus Obscuribacterales bacterium]|nr:serine/threonine protein kinase [Candidatus Obscuribacterales bacterium]